MCRGRVSRLGVQGWGGHAGCTGEGCAGAGCADAGCAVHGETLAAGWERTDKLGHIDLGRDPTSRCCARGLEEQVNHLGGRSSSGEGC